MPSFLFRVNNGQSQLATDTFLIPSLSLPPYLKTTNMNCCFSVRKFITSYTGPIFNVRRSSDNVTSDFYSDSTQSYLTTGPNNTGTSYATWISGATGYIVTWYDQSGKGNNATQTVTTAYQPSIILQNGKYVLQSIGAGRGNTQLIFNTGILPWEVYTHCNVLVTSFTAGASGYNMLSGCAGDNGIRPQGSTSTWTIPGMGYGATSINLYNGSASNAVTGNWTTASAGNTTNNLPSNLLGLFHDYSSGDRDFGGYCAEIIFYNNLIDSSTTTNAVAYYNNRLF
jgi:hypothetical protein